MDERRPGDSYQQRVSRSYSKEGIKQTEYLSKLALSRDSMVEQEQMRLAQALSRLGIQSSLNKDHSFRLRMNGSDTHNPLSPVDKASMTTTVEKFRHMRQLQQKQHQQPPLATLLPLEGRQIVHINLATSGDKNTQNRNSNKMAANGVGNSISSISSSALSEAEGTTGNEKTRTKKTTKHLRSFDRKVLAQQFNLESQVNHLHKVRPKMKPAVRHIVSTLSPADSLDVFSSQTSFYYIPVMSQDSAETYWHPEAAALENESPNTRMHNSTQTRRNTTRRMKHRHGHPVDDNNNYGNDMFGRVIQAQIHKGKNSKSRHSSTSFILPSIIEHPSLELICSRCVALDKKQMTNRMISNSAADVCGLSNSASDFHEKPNRLGSSSAPDFHEISNSTTDFHEKLEKMVPNNANNFQEKRSMFLQTNNNSKNINSRDLEDVVMKHPLESEQSSKKFLKMNCHRALEAGPEEDKDLIVSSLPTVSQNESFRQHGANVKRFYASMRGRNGFKHHTNLADGEEGPLEKSILRVLDSETDRSGPRKINIVIDIPDTQLGSTTPDADSPCDEEPETPTAIFKWADEDADQQTSRRALNGTVDGRERETQTLVHDWEE